MPDQGYSGVVTAAGTLQILIQSRPRKWSVTQVSVRGASAPAGSTCILRKNGMFITPIIATGGAAAGDPPVELNPSDKLTVDFTAHTPGTVFEATAFYDVVP